MIPGSAGGAFARETPIARGAISKYLDADGEAVGAERDAGSVSGGSEKVAALVGTVRAAQIGARVIDEEKANGSPRIAGAT